MATPATPEELAATLLGAQAAFDRKLRKLRCEQISLRNEIWTLQQKLFRANFKEAELASQARANAEELFRRRRAARALVAHLLAADQREVAERVATTWQLRDELPDDNWGALPLPSDDDPEADECDDAVERPDDTELPDEVA